MPTRLDIASGWQESGFTSGFPNCAFSRFADLRARQLSAALLSEQGAKVHEAVCMQDFIDEVKLQA